MKLSTILTYLFSVIFTSGIVAANFTIFNNCSKSKIENIKLLKSESKVFSFLDCVDLDLEEELSNESNAKTDSKHNFLSNTNNYFNTWLSKETIHFVLNCNTKFLRVCSNFSGHSNPIYISLLTLRI